MPQQTGDEHRPPSTDRPRQAPAAADDHLALAVVHADLRQVATQRQTKPLTQPPGPTGDGEIFDQFAADFLKATQA